MSIVTHTWHRLTTVIDLYRLGRGWGMVRLRALCWAVSVERAAERDVQELNRKGAKP